MSVTSTYNVQAPKGKFTVLLMFINSWTMTQYGVDEEDHMWSDVRREHETEPYLVAYFVYNQHGHIVEAWKRE